MEAPVMVIRDASLKGDQSEKDRTNKAHLELRAGRAWNEAKSRDLGIAVLYFPPIEFSARQSALVIAEVLKTEARPANLPLIREDIPELVEDGMDRLWEQVESFRESNCLVVVVSSMLCELFAAKCFREITGRPRTSFKVLKPGEGIMVDSQGATIFQEI